MKKLLLVCGLLTALLTNAQQSGTAAAADGTIDGKPFYIDKSYPDRDIVIVYQGTGYNKRYGLLEISTKKKLTPIVYQDLVGVNHDGHSMIKLNNLYGTIDAKGQVTIPCMYSELIMNTIDGVHYFMVKKNERYGIVNKKNEVLVPFIYDWMMRRNNTCPYVVVDVNSKNGLLNYVTGKMAIPTQYYVIRPIGKDRWHVKEPFRETLFDLDGKPAFANWYTELKVTMDSTLLVAELNDKKGVVNINEQIIVPFEYDALYALGYDLAKERLLVAKKGKKYGLIDITGKVILPVEYDDVGKLGRGRDRIVVRKDGKTRLLKMDGSPFLPDEYEDIRDLYDYFVVSKNGKYGLLSEAGTVVLPFEYSWLLDVNIEDERRKYLVGFKNGKEGIYDIATGKPRVDFIYDELVGRKRNTTTSSEDFNKAIIALKAGKRGMIDLDGKVLLPFVYDDLVYVNDHVVIVGKGGKYGLLEIYNNNAVVLPIEYNSVAHRQNTVIAIKTDVEKYRLSDKKLTKEPF